MGLIVVSDLDGTLLDHDSYSYAEAQDALDALRQASVPLILASSKTAAEVAQLHRSMDLGSSPAIVENGAGIYRPRETNSSSDQDYQSILAVLATLPSDVRDAFRGFGEMSTHDVASLTGLTPEAAALARQRKYSEPGIWTGSKALKDRFQQQLLEQGIHCRHGGRFLTLSHGRTKADALLELQRDLEASIVIALGDAPNDIEMLEVADYGVIVRNDHGPKIPPLRGESDNTIRRTQLPGPQGWNQAVLELLSTLDV